MGRAVKKSSSNSRKRPLDQSVAQQFVEEESDCGFTFRRAVKAPKYHNNAPAAATSMTSHSRVVKEEHRSVSNGEASLARRRRSSFAIIAAANRQGASSGAMQQRPSSIVSAVTVSLKMPSGGVQCKDYHKHLVPDLPGPVKMRQLLVWAAQSVASRNKKYAAMAESVVQALASNTVNTSWYQRSLSSDAKSETVLPAPARALGPKNQEIQDCITLYERYSSNLRRELDQWTEIQNNSSEILGLPNVMAVGIDNDDDEDKPLALRIAEEQEEEATVDRLVGVAHWMQRVPILVDQLQWTLSVMNSFESHSKVFCERVFHRIRAKLFGGEDERPSSLLLLRAMAAQQTAST